MKKRLLMTIGTAVTLCVITTFQFLNSDLFLLRAQDTEETTTSERTKASSKASSDEILETYSTTTTTKETDGTTPSSSSAQSASSSSSSSASSSSGSASSSGSQGSSSSSSSASGGASSGSSGSSASSSSSSASKDKDKDKDKDKEKEDSKTSESSEPVGVATPEEVEENYTFSISKNSTTQEFIDSIKKDAQKVAWDNDLYASVMMAQAILETGSGNSSLSREPNYNLFGIKGAYEGKSVTFATQEDDGSGTIYTIDAKFRKYPSVKESLEDYAELLKTDFYKGTWKSNTESYKDATKFLTGRYATDTTYNKKLDALIAAYKLTDFDVEPGTDPKDAKETEEKKQKALDKLAKSKNATLAEHAEANDSLADLLNEFSNLKPDYSYTNDGNQDSSDHVTEQRANDILASETVK